MSAHALLVPDVRRIAVLRANALGDFVYALPALDALRAAYPRAELVLLAREWHAALLADRPSPVDRVIPLPEGIPPDGGHPPPPDEGAALLDAIAAEGWDVAIQLHGGGRNSNPIVRALRPRVSVGSRTHDAAPLDRWIRYVYYQPEIARLLEVVGLIGAAPVTIAPRLAVVPADRAAAMSAVPELAGRRYAILHPGASDPRRRWPASSFAAVGDALAGRGLEVVVTGSDPERAVVGAVAAAMSTPPLDVSGRLDLPALVGLLAGAELVVANDTGPLHVATAVEAPSVGIFWSGNAVTAGVPTRARHRVAISWRVDCPVCGVNCMTGSCVHTDSFVADVPVGDVLGAAFDLLEPTGAPVAVAAG